MFYYVDIEDYIHLINESINKRCKIKKSEEFIYDLQSVIVNDSIKIDSFTIMSTLIFHLLFRKEKTAIYIELNKYIFNTLFTIKRQKNLLYNIFDKASRSLSINLNEIIFILFNKDESYEYIKYYINKLLVRTWVLINNALFKSKNESLDKKLNEILIECGAIFLAKTSVNECARNICDNFLSMHLFVQNIPDNIILIINNLLKKYIDAEKKQIGNEGTVLEHNMLLSFISEFPNEIKELVLNNIDVYDDNNDIFKISNIKKELDIIVGEIADNILNIYSIYDIKRSARLIIGDVNKFNNIINTKFKIKYNGQFYNTAFVDNFKKGYLYIYDWNIKDETIFLIRSLILDYINLYINTNDDFFDFCALLTQNSITITEHLKYFLENKIRKFNKDNMIKLDQFEIRKCFL